MIKITDKSKCCGCNACSQVCPKHCITMKEDDEGFLYPFVDTSLCINCGLCENVCPELNQINYRKPNSVYAAKCKDEEVRIKSSSGGIFTILAESVIDKCGVVFGARYDDNWQVIHDYVESKENLKYFRGSKYVQSIIGDSYKNVKYFLDRNRLVLFSGTACQIKGLNNFLRKDYPNLITIDVVCHGVPSPLVWKSYLKQIIGPRNISDVLFRDKISGWKNYTSQVYCSNNEEKREYTVSISEYMKLFLSDMILRPSCHVCPFKSGGCGSDMTLGDFWGIQNILPEFDDDKGSSIIFVYNDKVFDMLKKNIYYQAVNKESVVYWNPSIEKPVLPHNNRDFFFYLFSQNKNVLESYRKLYSKNILMRIYRILYRNIKS